MTVRRQGAHSYDERLTGETERIQVGSRVPLKKSKIVTDLGSDGTQRTNETQAMANRPKVLVMYLPSGDPAGIRETHITDALVRVIEVPNTVEHLKEFYAMPESKEPCVYFLLQEEVGKAKRELYIGQTSQVDSRFVKHHADKQFWQKALVASSRTEALSPAHLFQVEQLCISRARAAGRFSIHNGNRGQKYSLTKHMLVQCEDLFDDINLLLTTLGVDLFSAHTSSTAPLYQCTQVGVNARAQYSAEGMTVLKGSTARKNVAPNFKEKSFFGTRQKLIESGILKDAGEHLVYTEDYTFGSPSAAAAITIGNNVNGWDAWRQEDGKTLDEVIRKAVEPAGTTNGAKE